MTVIVEIRRRGGQLIERCRLAGGSLRVGRAYDNDVIVEDPFVSAHHIRLDPSEQGWQVTDLDSLNGYRIKSRRRTVKRTEVYSGEEVQIGQITLKIFHSHHQVPEPVKVNGFERYLKVLGWHRVWPFVLAVTMAFVALEVWQQSLVELRFEMWLKPTLSLLQAVGVVALLWAFAGRIFRHQAHFFSHLSVWALFFALLFFGDQLASLLGYNFSSGKAAIMASRTLQFLFLALAIWSSLLLAANFHSRGRMVAALCVSALFVSWQVLQNWQPKAQFSPFPSYHGGIRAPELTWVSPQPESAVSDTLEKLLEQAEEDAQKEVR